MRVSNIEASNMNHRLWLIMVVGLPLAAACQQFDSTASSQDPAPEFGSVPDPGNGTFPAQTQTPEILRANGETTKDPCVKVKDDATTILKSHCSFCHEGTGAVPCACDLKFIMEPDQMQSMPATSMYAKSVGLSNYVKAGDPDHSLIYFRAAIIGDMPKPPTDPTNKSFPATSLSENSILRQWITSCM